MTTRHRYRQVHLDFHTSPKISGVGSRFAAEEFQMALQTGHVDSVTCFATCHHGWSYYDTGVGERHPQLSFDLLRAQFDACKAIDVNVPIYLSAGVNNWASAMHPEWREILADGRYSGWQQSPVQPGFHKLCFHSPYLDLLCRQIKEVVTTFPDCDGVFLDIVSQAPCACPSCLKGMVAASLDPSNEAERKVWARRVLLEYYRKTTEAARTVRADMPVFHNSGHVAMGDRELLPWFSHLEIEGLPTGGWGYDYYPMTAAYSRTLGLPFVGQTGKFHTTWGEFGGFKHPNALRYEVSAMIASGGACSIGDQLHPWGQMDETTYRLIGQAYAEVEAKEPWLHGAVSLADIAVFSSESLKRSGQRDITPDLGAARILFEGHFLFDFVDSESDWTSYVILVLPDDIALDSRLAGRVNDFLRRGGKVFCTGKSGLNEAGTAFALPLGVEHVGVHSSVPDYLDVQPEFRAEFLDSPLVMYEPAQKVRLTSGSSLGQVWPSFFNRTLEHFCSHQHAPADPDGERLTAGSLTPSTAYLAHPIFGLYRTFGAVAYREYAVRVLRRLLGTQRTLEVELPSDGRVYLSHQPDKRRYIVHLLYAPKSWRGGPTTLPGGVNGKIQGFEVIEDLPPLLDVKVALRVTPAIRSVRLEPQGLELPFHVSDGAVHVTVPRMECHQMVVFCEDPENNQG